MSSCRCIPVSSSDKRRSVALGALPAPLDAVRRFAARRRIDALGPKILEAAQTAPLQVGFVFGAAERDRLDPLMAAAKLHLDQPAGRGPFDPGHRRDYFVGRGFFPAV